MAWLRHWWPALVWAALIWPVSTTYVSSNHTSRFLLPLLRWLLPDLPDATLEMLHLVIRKAGHVAVYFILSLLVLRGLRAGRAGWRRNWGLIAVVVAGGYASLDEVYQLFVPERGGSIYDVLLDVSGAVLAQGFAWWRARRQLVVAPPGGKR